ncbi:hypothetical protein PVK06_047728 [Gossypium arboreum]|uniref:Uncharacterized protein n=1 Tax=Gossypium arboreum TaxID=29729 RepID=A0ABR0MEK6_GOSAR|nr:hypothetical protein PVK06_047728 [Gossypium arboreum]
MMPEKDFNLERNDKMVVPWPIRKTIDALNWIFFCDARSLAEEELVREFYTNLIMPNATRVLVCNKKAPLTSKSISDFFNLLDVDEDEVQVKTKENLKGLYVQDCITAYNLEWLVENVHELNPLEPTQPETEESLNKFESEADSVDKTEEIESEEESNNPKLINKPEVSEPKEEMNADEPIEPSVDLELTIPMPTSSNTTKKSEFSIMMDMMKFMYNQQQACWKYVKIKDDFVRNAFKNISNSFVPKLLDYIFESWKEEDEDESEDESSKEEDEGDKSNNKRGGISCL